MYVCVLCVFNGVSDATCFKFNLRKRQAAMRSNNLMLVLNRITNKENIETGTAVHGLALRNSVSVTYWGMWRLGRPSS